MLINSSHTSEDRGLDAYWTPPEATKALVAIENLPKSVADPACGDGAILKILKEAGHIIHASDIRDYGYPHTRVFDYLKTPIIMNDVAIVTNPPYKLAEQFICKSLSDGTKFAAYLLRLNFLESVRRRALFAFSPPSRVWVSSRRLPMMHRLNWAGPTSNSNCCYAWFIWDDSPGTFIKWFDWRDYSGSPTGSVINSSSVSSIPVSSGIL